MRRSVETGPELARLTSLFLSLLILSSGLVVQASADCLTFHCDNQRTGNLSGEGPDEPNLLWSTSLTGHGYIGSAAAVSGDRVFVSNWPDMTFKGELGLAALDKETGKILWINSLGGKGGASTPAILGEKVFIGSATGDLYCINASTGETAWNRSLDKDPQWWGVASSPLVQNETVYVMSFSDGTLHALSPEGDELWKMTTGQVHPFASPSSSDTRLYFPGGDPALYCVDLTSHEILWKAPADSQITATPALEKDRAYFVTEKTIRALNASTGEEAWSREINGTMSTPAVSSGRVYVGTDDGPRGHLSCFDAGNGSLIWTAEANGPVKSSPIVLGGNVYIATNIDNGTIYAIDASNGSVSWTYPLNAFVMSSASASGGTLFMGADDGELHAFGSRPRGLIWSGAVTLEDGSLNLTATSGKTYKVNQTTALGALVKASEEAGLNLSLNDSLYDLYGLQIESIGDHRASGDRAWRFWVNYPQEAMPVLSPDLLDLADGDRVVFYYGDRRSGPEDSPRLEINSSILLKRPAALFLTVSNHPQIEEALNGSVLNVTSISSSNISGISNLSSYDLIFLEMLGADDVSRLRPMLDDEKDRGVPVIVLNSEGYEDLGSVNLSDYPEIQEYWGYSSTENMGRLFSYLAARFCGLDLKVEGPVPIPSEYICHPDSPDIFENITSYLDWYENNSKHSYNREAPTIGILSYYTDLGQSDINDLTEALEKKGANVIDVGFSNTSSIERLFMVNGTSIVDAVILTKSFRVNYGDPDRGVEDLKRLNVPVLRAIRMYYQTPDQWKNDTGIEPIETYFQIALPEMDGVIEPIVISGRNETYYEPIESQIDWLVDRTLAWAELKRKPNADKKLAIIYYNNAAGKGSLDGCYLNVPRSLENILDGLNRSGFRVQGSVPDEKALVDLLEKEGTNVGTWAPGELESMVEEGNAMLIPADEYISWFNALPEERQEEAVKAWGPPPGEIMVYRNGSGKYIVIPKLSFGNVILLPQPTRGTQENSTALYNSKDVPPHHQYIAFYLWLKKEFGADAIVHLGTHGTQEWLPGKECGISSSDWPALLIQNMPVVYPYMVDDISEGTQAKRRGGAVMITHLTPPIVASGLYGNLTNLAEVVFEYRSVQNASVKEGYRNQIINSSRELHLNEDLGVDLNETSKNSSSFDEFADELERYLYDLKSQFMPYGLHVFGEPPEGEPLVGLVKSMLGEGFSKEVAAMISYSDYPNSSRLDKEKELDNCTDLLLSYVIINGTSPKDAQREVFGGINVSGNLTDQLNLSIEYARNIEACRAEMPGLIEALGSSYTPPSPAGDPIRDPQVLPTGRNFRSVDPRRVPTSAAWEVGENLADELIERYRQDHNGTYPRKMAVVLWAWAVTDHGVVESEILHLVGAKPVYDAYGGVCDVELISASELGRPRIDVLVVPSGLHRDLFPEKLQLIDRAIRMASNDTSAEHPNYVRENSEEIFQDLMASGNISEEDARVLSSSRIFLEAAETYGPGLDGPISESDSWENDTELGNLFVEKMSYIYGDGIWSSRLVSGEDLSSAQEGLFRSNLADVDAAVQHTNSNLYGLIDNSDVFQYLGGIGLAVRTVTGATPDMYVTDARNQDQAEVSSLQSAFSSELRTRYYNPNWIKGMMEQGYSGAREMDRLVENLWGWETTVPDLVTESTWNEVHEIYVRDRYDLGLREFFDQSNPWAEQSLTGRMLEASRKDRWHPDEAAKAELAQEYDRSVQDYGAASDNHLLQEYVQDAFTVSENQDRSKSRQNISSYSKSAPSRSHSSGDSSDRFNTTQSGGVGTSSSKPAEPKDEAVVSEKREVQGMVMNASENGISAPSISNMPLAGAALALVMLLLLAAGFRKR